MNQEDLFKITPNPDPVPSDIFPVLDKGYVQLLDSMGNDYTPDTDARLSTGVEARNEAESQRLVRFLLRHKHTTPFEGCIVKLKVSAPIMVIREWFRHRTFSYNEESGRYKQLDPNYYVPAVDRISKQATTNRQGSGEPFSEQEAEQIQAKWVAEQAAFENIYVELCNPDGPNVAKELARLNMPVSHYSTFVATGNLLNWFRFLQLRMAPGAQFEIRQFANVIFKIIGQKFPYSTKAFEDYWLNAITFSAQEVDLLGSVIRELLGAAQYNENSQLQDKLVQSPMKGREIEEFKTKLDRIMKDNA